MNTNPGIETLTLDDVKRMSHQQKLKFLSGFSEDDFRDMCVRPLFELFNLRFVRDTCGTSEEGKDCLFTGRDNFGEPTVVAVQTKRGNLSMAGTKPADGIATAVHQLRMALDAEVLLESPQRKVRPHRVILVASGTINDAARRHIHGSINDNRIEIKDADWLVPRIDEHMKEFWAKIDKALFPYLRGLRGKLLNSSDAILLRHDAEGAQDAPFTDDAYAPLYLMRVTTKPVTRTETRIIERAPSKPAVPQRVVDAEPKLQEYEATEILRKSRESMILVLGEGGSGKTTALRRIAYKLIENALALKSVEEVPVLLSATSILRSPDDVLTLIASTCREISNSDSLPYSMEELASGKVVLLVDGLEEVGADENVERVLEKIVELRTSYPKVRLILTSREYGYLRRIQTFGAFATFRVTPLSLVDASKIVNRSLQGRENLEVVPQEVLRRLQDVHGLALTPMLVTVFVASADFKKRDIPPNITEIFKKYTELMLGRWDEKRGFAQQFEPAFKDLLLQRVAHDMHRARRGEITLAEFEALVRGEIGKRPYGENVEEVFHELLYRSNLLSVDGETVSFRHPLLREFFAGRAISSVEELGAYVSEDWWRRAIVFYFGEHPTYHAQLMEVTKLSENLSLAKMFDAAVTIGLAAQACYWAETSDRLQSLDWVVQALSLSLQDYAKEVATDSSYTLLPFLYCYIVARDAVATPLIQTTAQTYLPEARPKEHPCDVTALEQFWCIVGMMESGLSLEALEAVKRFNPEDLSLLLALDLGCFYIESLKVSTKAEKQWSHQTRNYLAPRISHLRQAVAKEFRSQLLELRDGRIVAIDVATQKEVEGERSPEGT